MSINNADRNVSVCIQCQKKRASHYGLWCDDCWNDVEITVNMDGGLICAVLGCDEPRAAGSVLCAECIAYYARHNALQDVVKALAS